MAGAEMAFKLIGIDSPGEIGDVNSSANHWSSDAETCRLNSSQRGRGEEVSPATQEILNNILETRVFVTRIAVGENDAEAIAFFLHQGEVRLGPTNIPRENH